MTPVKESFDSQKDQDPQVENHCPRAYSRGNTRSQGSPGSPQTSVKQGRGLVFGTIKLQDAQMMQCLAVWFSHLSASGLGDV